MVETLVDFRLAARRLRRSPGFAAAAVLTLALGLGANTAVFSVVYGILLRPLPYPNPDRIVVLWESKPEPGWERAPVSPADFLDWRQSGSAFSELTAYSESLLNSNLAGSGEPRAVRAAVVYGNFFSVFRVRPHLGRWLREEESWPGPPSVAVLSYRLWRELGADLHIVGQTLRLDGRDRTVVGVMPREFQYPSPDVDLWIPVKWQPGQVGAPFFRSGHSLRPVGRLRPEVSYPRARAILSAISGRLERQYPATHRNLRAGFAPLREWLIGRTETALLALFGASLFILLIACVNVANLQLARAIGRSRETAVRLALGASWSDLLGPPMAEGFLLSALGTLGGIGLAYGSTRLLLAVSGRLLPRAQEISVDVRVLTFSVVCGVGAALLASAAPALHSLWTRTSALRRGANQATVTPGVAHSQGGLAVAEIALAALLVFQAALLARGFVALMGVEPGFSSHGALTLRISLPPTRYRGQHEMVAFWSRLLERSEALPGVRWAGLADGLPLGGLQRTVDLYQEGKTAAEHGEDLSVRVVSADYFHALGVPLLSGRLFTREDGESAPRVVLINQSAAQSYFRGESPLGRRISFEAPRGLRSEWHTIVGVVADERVEGLTEKIRPEIYEALAQTPKFAMNLVLQSPSGPEQCLPRLREELRILDPTLALAEIRPLASLVTRALLPVRSLTLFASLFAVLALVLAAVGVGGVMTYIVAQRSRELGIRMALGATRQHVFLAVLGRALALLAAGSGIGFLGDLAVSAALANLRDQRLDLGTAGAVLLLLLGVGVMAGYLPARRAALADPAAMLRIDR